MVSKIKVVFDGGFGNQLFQLTYINCLKQLNNNILFNQEFYLLRGKKLNDITNLYLKENDFREFLFSFKRLTFFCFRLANKFNLKQIGGFYFDAFKFKSCCDYPFQNKSTLYSYFHNVNFDFVLNHSPFNTIDIGLRKLDFQTKCFVHIRGGDYLTAKNINIYTKLDETYYSDSIALMIEKYNVKEFVVFTNDRDYAETIIDKIRKNFNVNIIFSNNSTVKEDFVQMSSMQYAISSNSTFSFWSITSNYSTDKNVIVPKKWYVNDPQPSFLNKNWIYV